MTAVSLREVLTPALEQGYAVAGLVVLGWEDAQAYVAAGEELGVAIILQAGPGCRKHTPVAVLGKMFRHLADAASIPVVCHIDHGYSEQECLEGIDNGFTSVMFDGSKLPISENIDITARIVEKAHPNGVSVEGEVGFVGYADGAASAVTDPREARRFDRESGADALAISVGNEHLKTERTTGIDRDALQAIEAVTKLPLVLHGGSGIPADVRRDLAKNSRVCKFNIGTELRMAFGQSLRRSVGEQPDVFDRNALLAPTVEDVKTMTINVLKEMCTKPEVTS
ncbi:MAG: class II fructose-bisphosphate aldolase [Methyloligellaceae bacterium]